MIASMVAATPPALPTLASLLMLRLPWASLICALPPLAMHRTTAAAYA